MGGGTEPLIVHFTDEHTTVSSCGDSERDYIYLDATYAEVASAFVSGRPVIVDYGNGSDYAAVINVYSESCYADPTEIHYKVHIGYGDEAWTLTENGRLMVENYNIS